MNTHPEVGNKPLTAGNTSFGPLEELEREN
jgi:hypothetical protein